MHLVELGNNANNAPNFKLLKIYDMIKTNVSW